MKFFLILCLWGNLSAAFENLGHSEAAAEEPQPHLESVLDFQDGEFYEGDFHVWRTGSTFGGKAGIIAVGNLYIKLIHDNATPVQMEASFVHALPEGISQPGQLRNWKGRRSQPIHFEFFDPLGGNVADFDLVLTFLYDGQLKGPEKYLGNMAVFAQNVNIKSLYNLNVSVKWGSPIISNSRAAIKLLVSSSIVDRFLGGAKNETREYTVYGDGSVKNSYGLQLPLEDESI